MQTRVTILLTLSLLCALGVTEAASERITSSNVERLVRIADLSTPKSAVTSIFFAPDDELMITGNVNGEVLAEDGTTLIAAYERPSNVLEVWEERIRIWAVAP